MPPVGAVLLAFCLAIIAIQFLPVAVPGGSNTWVGVLALAAFSAWRRHWLLASVLLGLAWGGIDRWQQARADLDPGWEGVNLMAVGRIHDLPERRDRSARFYLAVEKLYPVGEPHRFDVSPPSLIRLSWHEPEQWPASGERWQFEVRLKRPRGFANPHGFDYAAWLWGRGVRATGYARRDGTHVRLAPAPVGIDRLRQTIADRLSEREGGLFTAMVAALALGDRSGLGQDHWRVLAATGTSHLLAISGLHVGLVALWGGWIVGLIATRLPLRSRSLPRQQAAALGGLLFAALYAALAGFSVPTQRALILVAVVALSLGLRRSPSPMRALLLALTVVLAWDPTAVFSAGFWLSFGAVALILYGMTGRLRVSDWWWRWGRVQWLVGLGLTPVLLMWFQRVSLASPLVNLIAVPVVGLLVVPLVLAGGLLMLPFPQFADFLLDVAEGVLKGLWWGLQHAANWPGTEWLLPAMPWPLLLAAGLGVAWLLSPRGWPGRWLGLVALLPVLLYRAPQPPPGGLWLTLLDVGQGLAAVVRTHGHALVYDTGPSYGGEFDTGWAVVGPYLDATGIGRVDRLVISNGDRDHAGGAESLVSRWSVAEVINGADPARFHLPGDRPCLAGEQWTWDGVRFRFLHPPTVDAFRGNDRSCVLHVQAAEGGSLLLPGDIEARAERSLLAAGPLPKVDVLVVPHHGSRSSSTAPFIDAVSPQIALFATGYRNRFGFPKPDVVRRYRDAGAAIYTTHEQGAVELRYRPTEGWGKPILFGLRRSGLWYPRARE
ncbi:MAG: DNA internalization-related competence protein ComEC/Rec2 [Chromatiales bacterium]|nr:DNA internalization-related competence protein ComEC/Rec2 [Chromatiales bacterium]